MDLATAAVADAYAAARCVHSLRARLHQASASTLRQLSDDTCDSVLIEISGIA